MKKIVLIGDSIRMGYDKYIRLAFEGQAEVYYPAENCRFAAYVLRNLSDWREQMQCGDDVDCVHFNAGLWDTLHLADGKPLTPIDVYAEYMERICTAVRYYYPAAKVIFATTTPVIEELYGAFKRYNREIEAYNERATAIVTRHGFAVNDLYALMKDASRACHSDMTHFYTKDGTRLITDRVASVIGETLGLAPKALDYDALFASVEPVGI